MVDIPINTDEAAEIIIYGVESEQIEEENDAYNDMRYELGEVDNTSNSNFYVKIFNERILGIHAEREDELDELMPSCFCLNMMDCISIKIKSIFCSNIL